MVYNIQNGFTVYNLHHLPNFFADVGPNFLIAVATFSM